MNVFISILSLFALVIFIILERLNYKRLFHIENIKRKYDEMEMFLIKNKVELTNNNIELLKMYKNVSVNPDFLDVQVLLMSSIAIEKSKGKIKKEDKKWIAETLDELGSEFKNIASQFDKHAGSIIKLSFYKPDFILFVLKMVIRLFVHKRMTKLSRVKKTFTFVRDNESIITYKAMNVC